ncbi:MAG: RAD55 family ATPase [Candidatus Dormibacteria bacterium]
MSSPERFPVYGLRDLAEAAEAAAARAEAARLACRQLGPTTGIGGLDAAVGGYLEPGLHLLMGNTGAGKTALALQLAAVCGAPACYLTAEMAAVELFRRIAARVNGTYLDHFRSGELDAGARSQFFAATVAACPQLWIADATEVPATLDQIAEVVAGIRGDAAPLVVIDSIHEWAGAVASPDLAEYESLNWALVQLRNFARREGVAVLGLAERNRANMKVGGLNAAAGTRKFEYGAHSVLDLERAENAILGSWPMRVDLTIHKNRSGSAGQKIPLEFDGRVQTYTEVRM